MRSAATARQSGRTDEVGVPIVIASSKSGSRSRLAQVATYSG